MLDSGWWCSNLKRAGREREPGEILRAWRDIESWVRAFIYYQTRQNIAPKFSAKTAFNLFQILLRRAKNPDEATKKIHYR